MITQAVVLADMEENEFGGRFSKVKQLKTLLGLSLVKRTILAAHAVGVKDFKVVVGYESRKVMKRLIKDKQLSEADLNITFLENQNYKMGDGMSLAPVKGHVEGEFFLLRADTVYDRNILKKAYDLYASNRGKTIVTVGGATTNETDSEKWKINWDLVTHTVREISYEHASREYLPSGMFIFDENIFEALQAEIDQGKELISIYEVLNHLPKKNLLVCDTQELYWQHINSKDDLKHAEKKLLNSVRKPTDGIVSRNLNRYISLFFSKWMLKVKIVPNVITVLNLMIGIASAFYIAKGGYFYSLIGALLFQLASITDGCDGEVAKLTYRSSRFGEWFDTACDNITYVAFLACLPFGLHREGTYLYIVLGVVTFVSAFTFVLMMIHYMNKVKAGGSLVKIVKDIEADAEFDIKSLRKTVNYMISKIAFMMRRDFFAFFFMLLCLFGFSFVIQWLAAFALLFACIYFYFYTKNDKALTAAV